MIAINKSDLDPTRAELAATQFRNALHLFPMPDSQWPVSVELCSGATRQGVPELWNKVMDYVAYTKANGYFYGKRQQQNLRILTETIENGLRTRFYSTPGIEERIAQISQDILDSKISAYTAAEQLLSAN